MENLTLGRKFPSGLLSDTPFHLPCSMAQRVKALLWSQADLSARAGSRTS